MTRAPKIPATSSTPFDDSGGECSRTAAPRASTRALYAEVELLKRVSFGFVVKP